MMSKEEQESVILREEIKSKATEFWQAKRIYTNLEKANDLVVLPILECRGTALSTFARKNDYTTDFVSAFNQVKRDARNIYVKHLEWFLDKGISMEEIKKYS